MSVTRTSRDRRGPLGERLIPIRGIGDELPDHRSTTKDKHETLNSLGSENTLERQTNWTVPGSTYGPHRFPAGPH